MNPGLPNGAPDTPQSLPASTPASSGGENPWIQMSLNQVNGSLREIKEDLKEARKQLELVDRRSRAAYQIAKSMPDISGHIKDNSVFMAKTELRLEQLSQNSVTKGQIAIWLLSAIIAAILAIGGAAWWIAEKYLIPILERLPPVT